MVCIPVSYFFINSAFACFLNDLNDRAVLVLLVGLLAAIPKDWKNAILHGNQEHTNEPKVTQLTVGNVSSKYARLMFAERSFCPPLTESYLREQTFTPSAVYELPFKITIENKLRSFQFKLIHNILPTNQRLWKMNVIVRGSPVSYH